MRKRTLRIWGAAGLTVTAVGVAAALHGALATGSAHPVLASGPAPVLTPAAADVSGASSPAGGASATTSAATSAKAAAPKPASASGATTGAGTGTGGAAGCSTPTPVARPTRRTVVGSGTTATCTAGALRSALRSGGYVTFDCGGGPVTIPVNQEITTTGTTVIDGGGKVTLDGGGRNRIFVIGQDATLSVRNLRFVNGHATPAHNLRSGGAIVGYFRSYLEVFDSTFENNNAGAGGAISLGQGRLTVVRSAFKGNSSSYGGAIHNLLEPMTVVDSTFSGNKTSTNEAGGEGGAIVTDGGAPANASSPGGQLLICGSTFTGNSAHNGGGGVFLWAYARDQIIVQNSTFASNSVAGQGGGLRASIGKTDYSATGTLLISGTTVMSNTATGNGGGLYIDCLSSCDLQNSTFYRNTSKAYGGAVFGDGHHDNGVTYANNFASGHGGALFGTKFVLNNTVFVGNAAGNPWGQAMSCSSTGTGSHVLQWLTSSRDGSTPCIGGRVTSANPQLQQPAANGGPTVTMMPSATSPVLRAGAGCLPRDQRGVARGATCDLGAVQRG
ncbi:MAG TPA: choice-of-anchor Q domain-containing protein [Mycobacterium sp.]|nr:choice-of-anchor Q domain-containing protein [Mycobacterium sp.]